MKLELVESRTTDKLTLHGILYAPNGMVASASHALLFVHGAAFNFYETPLRHIAELLVKQGYPCLVTNTRGHDCVANSYRWGGYIGNAFEVIEDCLLDLDAAIATLNSRGYSEIAIVAHSFGAIKALYYKTHRANPAIKALALCSPPKLSFDRLSSKPGFTKMLAAATDAAEQGDLRKLLYSKVPIPGFISARTFIDRYGPDEKCYAAKFVERVNCPALLIAGTREPSFQFAEEIRDMTSNLGWQYGFIQGADHFYRGFEDEVAERIGNWLRGYDKVR